MIIPAADFEHPKAEDSIPFCLTIFSALFFNEKSVIIPPSFFLIKKRDCRKYGVSACHSSKSRRKKTV